MLVWPAATIDTMAENLPMFSVLALPTLEALRQYVLEGLCQRYNLDPAQMPLREIVITRRGNPCGLFFEVQGPRLLKTYAIWAGEENRILFYDTNGERFAETRLSDTPDPCELANPVKMPAKAA
jgi:hypothetical protein